MRTETEKHRCKFQAYLGAYHPIDLAYGNEKINWLHENIEGLWCYETTVSPYPSFVTDPTHMNVFFEKKKDLMLYKLVWG